MTPERLDQVVREYRRLTNELRTHIVSMRAELSEHHQALEDNVEGLTKAQRTKRERQLKKVIGEEYDLECQIADQDRRLDALLVAKPDFAKRWREIDAEEKML